MYKRQAFEANTGPGMGMSYVADFVDVPLDDVLDAILQSDTGCTDDGREDFADGVFTGRVAWVTCGELAGVVVVGRPDEKPSGLVVVIAGAATEADLVAIEEILSSFNVF